MLCVPRSAAFLTEEVLPQVIVYADDCQTTLVQKPGGLATD
jgi:hypothetical protein